MRAADAERRVLRRWTIAAFAIVLVATLGVAATYTTLFAAKDIRVRGSHPIPRAEILSLAHVNDRSNVFHLDASAVEHDLVRLLHGIERQRRDVLALSEYRLDPLLHVRHDGFNVHLLYTSVKLLKSS